MLGSQTHDHNIRTSSDNIDPQECENLLITHPKVADAAVFGVPNEEMGEEMKGVMRLMPDSAAGAEMEAPC